MTLPPRHAGPAVRVIGEPFEKVEQPATLARQPVVAGLIDLDQPGFTQLAQPLRQPVLGDAEPACQRAERLRGTAKLPEGGERVPAREKVDERL